MSTPVAAVAGQESQIPNVTSEIQVAVRHTAVYGLGNVMAKVLGFAMIPFYTHYLNPKDYGILEILDLSMSLFGMFLAMGMTAAMLRSYAAADSEERRQGVIGSAFLFCAVTGVGVYLSLLWLVRPVSAMLFGPSTSPRYLLVAFTSFITGYILNVPRTYLRAREASGAFVGIETAGLFLMLILNVVFIVVFKIGLMGILLSSLVVASLQLVTLTIWMLRRIRIRYSNPALWKMLQFGFPLMFSNMAVFALNFSDRFFLQRLQSLEIVGIYAVGYKFGFMLNYLLVQPFYTMWQSRMYIIQKNDRHGDIIGQMFMLYSVLLIFAGTALSIFSPEIVALMVGQQFAGSRDVIPVVALAYAFYGIGYFAQTGMFFRDKTNLVGAIGAASAVLNLCLNYFLIRSFGMMGAAWATLLSFAAIAAGSYWLSQRVYRLPLDLNRVLAALVIGIGLAGASRLTGQLPMWSVLLIKGSLLPLFLLMVWKARVLSPSEVSIVEAGARSLIARLSAAAGLRRPAAVRP